MAEDTYDSFVAPDTAPPPVSIEDGAAVDAGVGAPVSAAQAGSLSAMSSAYNVPLVSPAATANKDAAFLLGGGTISNSSAPADQAVFAPQSINPQTTSDDPIGDLAQQLQAQKLAQVGRKLTAQEITDIYATARAQVGGALASKTNGGVNYLNGTYSSSTLGNLPGAIGDTVKSDASAIAGVAHDALQAGVDAANKTIQTLQLLAIAAAVGGVIYLTHGSK
jgi:hypothetical protein